MRKVTGAEALKALMSGEILEKYERYFQYNDFMKELFYSDDLTNWISSRLTINELVNQEWAIIEK